MSKRGLRATNQTFYDRISHAYDFIADAGEHRAREAGQRALALRRGESVLEIGFGTGNSVLDIAAQVGAAGRVCGVDVSPGMLDVARKKLAAADVATPVDLQVGDGRHLPHEDGSFDAVFLSFTLELFAQEDIPVVLAEASRVLKPGGRLGVVAMSKVPDGQYPSLLERAYVWMHRHFPHIVDCEPIEVSRLLGEAGFAVESASTTEIWTMPVAMVIGRKGG